MTVESTPPTGHPTGVPSPELEPVGTAGSAPANDGDVSRPDRRRVLKTAGLAGAALWVAPAVIALDASPAAASTCSCPGGSPTASLQFLTAKANTTPNPLPTTCGIPTGGQSSSLTVCRTSSTQKVYLWGTGTGATGTNGPLFDDMGIVTVTDRLGTIRYGNIYRFQNYCRQGGSAVPSGAELGGYSDTVQRVWYAGSNIWDYLPPQPAGGSSQTTNPPTWWTNSQPGTPNTQSTGNPGYTVDTPWPGPIDISLLFGNTCGSFTVTVADWNRYQQYKWSNIFIGTTHP